MFLWVESQPTPVIVLMMFGLCYLLAAIIFVVARAILHRLVPKGLTTISSGVLSAIGVFTGLVIAFVASHVWTNLRSAESTLVREASAIRDVVLLADALPDDVRTKIRTGLKNYLKFVEAEDWPAMTRGSATLRRPPLDLTGVLSTTLAVNAVTSGQQIAQQRIVIAIEQALDARRQRILLSEAAIDPTQWLAIFALATLMMVTIVIVHRDRPGAAAGLLVFSSAVAACIVLLMVSDRPFSYGGITLEPTVLHEVVPD